MFIQGKRVEVGTKVRLTTYNTYDSTIYIGTIIGTCTYNVARVYGDLAAYHANVRKNQNITIGTDPSVFTYVLVQDSDGAVYALAKEWIDTVTIMDDVADVTIKVSGIALSTEIPILMDLIHSAGFNAKLITIPEMYQ